MVKSFEYSLSKDDYRRGLKALTASMANSGSKLGSGILELIVLVAAVLGVMSILEPWSFDAILLTLFLTLAGGCWMQTRFARRVRDLTYDADQAEIKLSMDERGLVVFQRNMERRYSWDAIRRIHELPEAIVLEMADWHAVTMPSDLWAGQADRASFVDSIRAAAKRPIPEEPLATVMNGSQLVLFLGAGAIGLQLMILAEPLIQRVKLNDCSCGLRQFIQGPWINAVPILAYLGGFAAAIMGLRRLAASRPRTSMLIAIIFMVGFVALQTIPPAMQIVRFFNNPGR